MILSAVYMLWMFQRVFYGEVTNDHNKQLPDLSFREWAIIGPLAAAAIFMGVVPNVFLKPMEPAVQRIVERVQARQPLRVDAVLPTCDEPTARRGTATASTRAHPDAQRRSGGADDQRLTSTPSSRCSASPWPAWSSCWPKRSAAEDERMPIGGLAIIGLVGAGVASVLLWDRNADQLRRRHRRQLRAVRQPRARRRRHPDRGLLVADHRARRLPAGEYYAHACCSPSSA